MTMVAHATHTHHTYQYQYHILTYEFFFCISRYYTQLVTLLQTEYTIFIFLLLFFFLLFFFSLFCLLLFVVGQEDTSKLLSLEHHSGFLVDVDGYVVYRITYYTYIRRHTSFRQTAVFGPLHIKID